MKSVDKFFDNWMYPNQYTLSTLQQSSRMHPTVQHLNSLINGKPSKISTFTKHKFPNQLKLFQVDQAIPPLCHPAPLPIHHQLNSTSVTSWSSLAKMVMPKMMMISQSNMSILPFAKS